MYKSTLLYESSSSFSFTLSYLEWDILDQEYLFLWILQGERCVFCLLNMEGVASRANVKDLTGHPLYQVLNIYTSTNQKLSNALCMVSWWPFWWSGWQRGFPWCMVGPILSAWCMIEPKLATWGVIGHSSVMSDILFSEHMMCDFPLKFPWWLISLCNLKLEAET